MDTYVVVVIHSFTQETSAYGFDNLEDAQNYLQWIWELYYNEEIANNSTLLENECYHEDDYARLTWADNEHTEFVLSTVLPPDERWKKNNK